MTSQNANRAVLIFSGGMDSAVLLCDLLHQGKAVQPLHFGYGQKHSIELEYGRRLCRELGLTIQMIQPPQVVWNTNTMGQGRLFKGSSQTDTIAVPHGHYADESMRKTVVPNRNMVMLALATTFCLSNNFSELYFAAHAGDHAIYPDCRPEFVDALASAIRLGSYEDEAVELKAPYIRMTKAEICLRGATFNVPFRHTYSCYEGHPEFHCGKCGTCVERREAFQLAGVEDPTVYA